MSLDDHHLDDVGDEDVHGMLALEEAVAAVSEQKALPRKKRNATSLRKAPNAPKRFKSSYICFFMAKQPEIKEALGEGATVTSISKRSAEMWKNLSPEEKAHWEEEANKDKQRYNMEKATYTGPWQVPWKRARKDPSAPKRPMSAFLYFAQGKRSEIKADNPEMKNTDISRVLGEMWRDLSEEERAPFVNKESEEREKYKVAIAEWRKEAEAKQEAEKKALAEQAELHASLAPMSDLQAQLYPTTDQFGALQLPMGNPYVLQNFQAPQYPPQNPNPYQYPTNGKQPVILGPSGTPVYPHLQASSSEAAAVPPFSPQEFEDEKIAAFGTDPPAADQGDTDPVV